MSKETTLQPCKQLTMKQHDEHLAFVKFRDKTEKRLKQDFYNRAKAGACLNWSYLYCLKMHRNEQEIIDKMNNNTKNIFLESILILIENVEHCEWDNSIELKSAIELTSEELETFNMGIKLGELK